MRKLIIYNHGKDSIPWGEKAIALSAVAKHYGYEAISPDYQAVDDPDRRVAQLLAMDLSAYDRIVLIGSSMGAYVATLASETIKTRGLFLMAPAFYLPGYNRSEFMPGTELIEVFHGWRDDIVPPEYAWRFCRQHRACLHMLDADHRLLSVLPEIEAGFKRFLATIEAWKGESTHGQL